MSVSEMFTIALCAFMRNKPFQKFLKIKSKRRVSTKKVVFRFI